MAKTTAQLRKEAREAENKRNYKEASLLYGLAIESYPEDAKIGELYIADMAYLGRSKKEMEVMMNGSEN